MRAYTKPKYGIQEDLQEWYEHVAEQKKEKDNFYVFLNEFFNPYSPFLLGKIKIFLN